MSSEPSGSPIRPPRGDVPGEPGPAQELTAPALPLLAAAIGLVLLMSSIFRLHPTDTLVGSMAVAITGLTGAGLLLAAVVLARQPDSYASAHRVAAVIMLVAAIALCAAMVTTGSLAHTAYMELLVVAAGAVLLRTRWFVVTVSAIWSLWLGVAAMLSGTTDPAGWLLALLAATVVAAVIHVVRLQAVQRLDAALESARQEAVRDPLTGLLNRRGLEVVGAEVLALAQRSRDPVSCTFVDIDGLKEVNDALGHDSGDALIREVGEALHEMYRRADVVARWGGDEFVVIAFGSGPRVEDIERRIADRLPQSLKVEMTMPAAISAGRVVHMPWQDEEFATMIERADQEMYRRRRLRRSGEVPEEAAW